MESELVRRRIDMISAHFAPSDEISTTHVLPLNCSGSMNSVLSRRDNKVYFARQASASFGYFMRQASVKEGDSTTFIAPKIHGGKSEGPSNPRAPCFARPARTEPMTKVQGGDSSSIEPPKFSRPSKQIGQRNQLNYKKNSCHPDTGTVWSPRMDVVESEGKYVIAVEVPGVSINDIRVEVDDQKLCVKGRRSTSYLRVAGCPKTSSFSSYHKREILHGPYEVVWSLPPGVNMDNISAEFSDGFLQIIVPKVSV
uniref:SHSP domain-containing protein n=1 Tax=Lotus japonicus TaxID=34305 RepID=I3SGI4_LOTJA|nr:unknown [Lotus japonicus]